MSEPAAANRLKALPLFPLGNVLFPDGLLGLNIFETRYLSLMSRCLRQREPFGVLLLTQGAEVRKPGQEVAFESVGVLAELLDCDSPGPGLMKVRCRGTQRFACGPAVEQAGGLWVADVSLLPGDSPVPPPPELAPLVDGLKRAIQAFGAQDAQPFLPPWRMDDAGWVANRWCEILPLPAALRQQLMVMPDPLQRLAAVGDILQQQPGPQH